ncbi:MAG TPA: 16S rRNA (guanine(527)-N(7))-methyltransferase RsmG [Candidatus Eremiobacteraceae bacterium]|nr:16S rRNA (guanine(527)-N(7))-methyltransferase RsmG [Candidatus Eremiobacteraceae bacterium]
MTEGESRLREGLITLGFSDDSIADQLLRYADLVLEANRQTNLVGASSLEELVAAHLLDSLAPLSDRTIRGRVIDIGSGAGFPGIPIGIAFAPASLMMLEPRAKRVDFLSGAIEQLGLKNVDARKSMAETAGRSDLRESADLVSVRAVASPAIALELSVPLLKRHGRALLYVGRQPAPTDHELDVADMLGAALLEAKPVEVPYLQGVRHGWWFEKKKSTPHEYPRRAKVPSKQPL